MKKIWITGANGFIGRHLAQQLSKNNCDVHGLGHGIWNGPDIEHHNVKNWLNGDITGSNLSILQSYTGLPDIIYHLAGGSSVGISLINPREDFSRTVESSIELLDWTRLNHPAVKLIVISSAAVYGNLREELVSEEITSTPYSPYGVHKHLMEHLCESYATNYGLHISIARLFSVYGPGLRKQLLWDMCCRLHRCENPLVLGGTGRELRDWTDVRDVAAALYAIHDLPSPSVPIINIGTGTGTSVRQVAEQLIDAWGMTHADRSELQFSGFARMGDPFRLVADTSKLKSMGIHLKTKLQDGLVDYVNWYTNHGHYQP